MYTFYKKKYAYPPQKLINIYFIVYEQIINNNNGKYGTID
ncbi:putative ORfan [Saudi moumouvirus]|nr:putative ORfan [Saudi moumouvirus]